MFLSTVSKLSKLKTSACLHCRVAAIQSRYFSQDIETKYSEAQKEKLLKVINESDADTLAEYDVTKGRIKKFSQWRGSNGKVKSISDLELVEGFSIKTAVKLYDSILEGSPKKVQKELNKIKGQILHPNLSEAVRQSCKQVLSLYISVNSICWTLIEKSSYKVVKWHYHNIDYNESKKMHISDILDIAWEVTQKMPSADVYVMKAEATTLRAAGSDPNNPKVIAVNLQKSQMVAMIVALISAKHHHLVGTDEESTIKDQILQRVYFLRPTLPFRLYGTLVGNERVSTDQTVEMLLQESNEKTSNSSHVFIPGNLQEMFRSQKDLQKDMLGHSLLLGLTFMDLCIYKNQASIDKLMRRRND